MFTSEAVSEKKFENLSAFGEVMDSIVVPCFFLTHSVVLILVPLFHFSSANCPSFIFVGVSELIGSWQG